MDRVIITITPLWEGGYNVVRGDEWVGSCHTLAQAEALAIRAARQLAEEGRVALVVRSSAQGDIEALQCFDPLPPDALVDLSGHSSDNGVGVVIALSADRRREQPVDSSMDRRSGPERTSARPAHPWILQPD